MNRKWNYKKVKEFIENNSNCQLISTEYINYDSKLKFRCNCGKEFLASFEKFYLRNKRQCNNCSTKKHNAENILTYEKVKKYIEENSNCKLLSTEYINSNEKLKLKCTCGNEFLVAYKHFRSSNQRQCPECGEKIRAQKRRLNTEYIKKYIEESGDNCEWVKGEYKNSSSKIGIKCNCGNIFFTRFDMYRNYNVRICNICRQNLNLKSKGEKAIEEWLINNNINYKTQIRFDNCRNKNPLPFDFGIYNDNNELLMLIEFDGKQHYGLGNFSSDKIRMQENFMNTKKSDKIKNDFCQNNNIKLLRIPYNKYYKIEHILQDNTEITKLGNTI